MQYYDLKKNWRKVKRHLQNEDLNQILMRDFNKYTYGRWNKPFTKGMVPEQFDSTDWRLDFPRRCPAFWRYACGLACHWLVNFNLKLAMLVAPTKAWRILTSDRHSTVWDGEETLFEFTFQAKGIPPKECFELARNEGDELPPGECMEVYYALHYTEEDRLNDGDILKFPTKMPLDALFSSALEPFAIVEGEVVNESGNESDVPNERFLVYRDVWLH